jgi:very-short-patch-repair endonuclease
MAVWFANIYQENKMRYKLSYTPILCSCGTCKKQITTANIAAHHHKCTQLLFPPKPRNFNKPINYCLNCGKETTNPKLCSRTCNGNINNNRRHSEETKAKIQASTIKNNKTKRKYLGGTHPPKPNACVVCGEFVLFRKTCSHTCFIKLKSAQQSHRLKTDPIYRSKLGTANRSYMETSFESWLKSNYPSLDFQIQHPIRNNKQQGYFYIDFFIPSLNLGIELDGTQHIKNKKHDIDRDSFILQQHKIYIFRITASEYYKKAKIEIVKTILS